MALADHTPIPDPVFAHPAGISPARPLPDGGDEHDNGFAAFASDTLGVFGNPKGAIADGDEGDIETVAEDCRVLANALYLLTLGGFVTVEKVDEAIELARSLR